VPSGVVWFAHRDDGFEALSIDPLRELGIPFARLSAAQVRRRWPVIGTADLSWALHEPEAGALLARRGVAAVAERVAAGDGGELRIARVLAPDEADAADGRLRRIRLERGAAVEADAFVFACGPWLPQLFPELLSDLIAVTRQELVYVAPPAGERSYDAMALPAWVDYDRAFYGIGSVEGRGMKCAPDWLGPPAKPDAEERLVSEATVAAVRQMLGVRFPQLRDRPVAEGRVCQYESTPDTNFLIDRHPTLSNAWIVGGGSGHGFKHGPVIGELVAALVAGDDAATRELSPRDGRFGLVNRATPTSPLRTSGSRSPDDRQRWTDSSAAPKARKVSVE
jgi:glycine/D-amino acid oxidase-like deaminating enzyme